MSVAGQDSDDEVFYVYPAPSCNRHFLMERTGVWRMATL
jgi:hypothetical protein